MNDSHAEENQASLSLQEPLVPKTNQIKWEGSSEDNSQDSLIASTKANSSRYDTDSSNNSTSIFCVNPIRRVMRTKGDQQRKLINLITFMCLIVTAIFLHLMRHSKWTTTYLIVETKDPFDKSVLSSNSTDIYDAEFKSVQEWWDYSDGFFLFGLIVKLYLNVFPVLKLCLHVTYWMTVIVGPKNLRIEGVRKVLVVNSMHRNSRIINQNSIAGNYDFLGNLKDAFVVFLSKVYELFAMFDLYLNFGPKQNLITYMLVMIQIATSHTFAINDIDYTFEWAMGDALVYTQLVLIVSDITMLFFRSNYLRWKRRQRFFGVSSPISDEELELEQDSLADEEENENLESDSISTQPHNVVIHALLREDEEYERANSKNNIFRWWRDLSIQQKGTIWVVITFIGGYLLSFLTVIKFNYSGQGTRFLEETSEAFTIQEIITAFTDRAHSKGDNWIGAVFYFEVILFPQLLLSASILVKAIRHTDKESEWIFPLYTFISYFKYWSGWDTFTYAVVLSILTLKYAIRQITKANQLCSELGIEADEQCFEVEAVFQPGTWVLIVYYFSWGNAVLMTNFDLMKKLEPIADTGHYGINSAEQREVNSEIAFTNTE